MQMPMIEQQNATNPNEKETRNPTMQGLDKTRGASGDHTK